MEPISLTIHYAEKVEKYLDNRNERTLQNLRKAINKLKTYPPEGVNSTLMVGKGTKGLARVKVGDYRIIVRYEFTQRAVYIELIDTREDVYRKH
jgi:mRNA-degrading endonuclease RelE of RelBE toxin-antitoxin system